MKSFSLPEDGILRIIEGLVNDLILSEARLTTLDPEKYWTIDLTIGGADLPLEAPELELCIQTISRFFTIPKDTLPVKGTVGDWVQAIRNAITHSSLHIHFPTHPVEPNELNSNRYIAHRMDCLLQEAAAAASLLHGRRRMVSLAKPHQLISFLLTLLTPTLQQIECSQAHHLPPDDLQAKLKFGDVVVATPTTWSYLMREDVHAPDNTMAVSFGEPMTADLASRVRRNGFAVLREFYGSTATGLIAWRDNPEEEFILFDHWLRDGDNLLRIQPETATLAAEPLDHLQWTSNRQFFLNGRRDGGQRVGAMTLFPEKISQQICNHEMVADCEIRCTKMEGDYNRLVADITLHQGIQPSEASAREIDGWCRSVLAIHERPHIYHFFLQSPKTQ